MEKELIKVKVGDIFKTKDNLSPDYKYLRNSILKVTKVDTDRVHYNYIIPKDSLYVKSRAEFNSECVIPMSPVEKLLYDLD